MRILNLISTITHGRGGHVYDFITIGEELQKHTNLICINICKNESEVLNKSKLNLVNIKYNWYNSFSVYKSLNKIVTSHNITHINCYDLNVSLFAKLVAYNTEIKVILTKCGGPNPPGYYPRFNNMLVMSKENFDFFADKVPNIVLIPNRVKKCKVDSQRVHKIKSKIPLDSIILFRISRIVDHYKTTLEQTVSLFNYLNKKDRRVKLVLVGVVQDNTLFQNLKSMVINKSSAFFFIEDEFTVNASELIEVADLVVGTGRGLMEASSLGKILLTPLFEENYPIVVNDDNFDDLFSTNFSPRNRVSNYSEEKSLSNIINLIECRTEREKMEQVSIGIYENKFDVSGIKDPYFQFFRNCVADNSLIFYDIIRLLIINRKFRL